MLLPNICTPIRIHLIQCCEGISWPLVSKLITLSMLPCPNQNCYMTVYSAKNYRMTNKPTNKHRMVLCVKNLPLQWSLWSLFSHKHQNCPENALCSTFINPFIPIIEMLICLTYSCHAFLLNRVMRTLRYRYPKAF